jgi:hypothetical protein
LNPPVSVGIIEIEMRLLAEFGHPVVVCTYLSGNAFVAAIICDTQWWMTVTVTDRDVPTVASLGIFEQFTIGFINPPTASYVPRCRLLILTAEK